MKFFGRQGIEDLLNIVGNRGFTSDIILKKWNATCKKNGIGYVDFELIRIYKRYLELNILSWEDEKKVEVYINSMNMSEIASILEIKLPEFIKKIEEVIEDEKGQSILKLVSKSIYNNIQYKLWGVMEA